MTLKSRRERDIKGVGILVSRDTCAIAFRIKSGLSGSGGCVVVVELTNAPARKPLIELSP